MGKILVGELSHRLELLPERIQQTPGDVVELEKVLLGEVEGGELVQLRSMEMSGREDEIFRKKGKKR